MVSEGLLGLRGSHVVVVWPEMSWNKRVDQGELRRSAGGWTVVDPIEAPSRVHPRFLDRDVARIVELSGRAMLLMKYEADLSGTAQRAAGLISADKAKGGAYGSPA